MNPPLITELSPLARGGMAELHVGRMQGLAGADRLVVVKRILPELAGRQDFVDLFLREARVATQLHHPNIVQTHHVGEDEDGYFIAMEYLQGMDLRQLLKVLREAREPIPHAYSIHIAIGMLAGLHHAHVQSDADGRPLNVVHCDVSPHNTFLTWEGTVKLLDFGVAQAADAAPADDDLVQGKLRYMSPEQCLSAPVDPRSDVYSVGVVLYELLTGRRAHPGSSPEQIQRHLLDQPVAAPSAIGVDLPPTLEQVVLRALRKRRAERWQTAQDFQLALESFCRDHGVYTSAAELGAWLRERAPAPQQSTPNRTASITLRHAPDSSLRGTAHADLRVLAGITVVHMRGVLNEAFDGRALGEQLDGPVLFDLDEVERITSFGIRAWLEMLQVSLAKPLYFARMPEAFVGQVAMIRGLVGTGRVLSFYAPYLCDADQTAIRHLVTGEAAQGLIAGEAPAVSCPHDATHRPELDEDPSLYSSLAAHFEPDPPAQVLGALAELDTARDQPAIEKIVEGTSTTVLVRRALDGALRWRRLLDGVEGQLGFDLSAVTSHSPEGIDALVDALRLHAPDLDSLTLDACPPELYAALRASSLRRLVRLRSLAVVASCANPECEARGVPRPAAATPGAQGQLVVDPCRLCLSPMQSAALDTIDHGATPAPVARAKAPPARRGCLATLFPFLSPRS